MSSLYKEQFRTEVFIAVLLVYLTKTLQYVVWMVDFNFFLYLWGDLEKMDILIDKNQYS